MADFEPLPADDEAPGVLSADAEAYLRSALPGWQPSTAAVEVALAAAFAEEGATLYSLARERDTDQFRDLGVSVFGVAPGAPTAATTTLTITARDAAGYELAAGERFVIDAPQGRIAFQTVVARTLAATQTVLTDVLVAAVTPGQAATGATGPVLLDNPPAWIASVTVDAAALGGTDGMSDEQHLDEIKANARLLHVAAVDDDDHEMVLQRLVPGVARALVLDRYDLPTETDNVDGAVTVAPIDAAGADVSSGTRALCVEIIKARSVIGDVEKTYATTADRNNIALRVTVARKPGIADGVVEADVDDAVRARALNPALHGQPALGERRSWKQRRTVRLYEVASTIDLADSVEYVDQLLMSLEYPVSGLASTDVLTAAVGTFVDGDAVEFKDITGLAPLGTGTYYVRDVSGSTFKVAASLGGPAVNISSDGTATLLRWREADLEMLGAAPLPNVTTVDVTVVDPG